MEGCFVRCILLVIHVYGCICSCMLWVGLVGINLLYHRDIRHFIASIIAAFWTIVLVSVTTVLFVVWIGVSA